MLALYPMKNNRHFCLVSGTFTNRQNADRALIDSIKIIKPHHSTVEPGANGLYNVEFYFFAHSNDALNYIEKVKEVFNNFCK